MNDPQMGNILTGASLIVKCLSCGSKYDEEDVIVTLTGIFDDEFETFVQYDVTFTDVHGATIFIQDLLCLPKHRSVFGKHCSVFGRLPNGTVFAFPSLRPGRGNVWHSSPDRNGHHYATGHAKTASAK